MDSVISNTSPLLYLNHVEALEWLPRIFDEVRAPGAVVRELGEGRRREYDVPIPENYEWIHIVEPRSIPSEWLVLDYIFYSRAVGQQVENILDGQTSTLNDWLSNHYLWVNCNPF